MNETANTLKDLSAQKWRWMADQNVDELDRLFHRDARFVHMGATMTKDAELDVIRTGGIRYQKADVHDVQVPFLNATTGIVLSDLDLLAVVGGNEVTNPFAVTEVFVHEGDAWLLTSMSFTRLLTR